MKKTLLTLTLLAIAGTAMAAQTSKEMSISSGNIGNQEQVVSQEFITPDNKTKEMPSKYVNIEYRYIEIKNIDYANSIDKKIELFPKEGASVLGMELENTSDITKFVEQYGKIERDDTFINEILLNDYTGTVTVYKNNKTREFTYSNIYLNELKDNKIGANVKFQFDRPIVSENQKNDSINSEGAIDNISTNSMMQRFLLEKNGKYKLVNYGSSFGKAHFIYIKVFD